MLCYNLTIMEFDPHNEKRYLMRRFVRVEAEIYAADNPSDFSDSHTKIAERHGILNVAKQLRDSNSIDVDAGYVEVNENTVPPTIIFKDKSSGLNLPPQGVASEARMQTETIAREIYPGFAVEAKLF
jgi:hypothetical protein